MQFTLPNGLHVILEEDHSAPVVALHAWVQVGSADESDEEAGLAHLHEHMLFKGTRKRGPGEVAKDIESRGGLVNAWTSFDQTVYHLTIASRFFEDGLEILSDQVQGSIFDEEELAREIEVVLEEIKRANDMPARRASKALFEQVFREHTYGRPVIGFPETVRGFRREDVVRFYDRHYTPDNITLVLVGDFEAARAKEAVERLWGGATGTHGGRNPRKTEPEQRSLRAKILREQVHETHLALAWPIPGILADELVVLDLAAAILGHGDSSRLNQEVKQERRLCNQIYSYAYTPKDPGIFMVGAMLRHEQAEAAIQETLRQVYGLRKEGPSSSELEIAKHLLESQAIWQKETVQGVARKLGFYATVTGSLDFEERYYERLRSVTAEEIREVCDRFLRSERMNAVVLAEEAIALDEERIASLASEAEAAVSGVGPKAAAAVSNAPAAGAATSAAPRNQEASRQDRSGRLAPSDEQAAASAPAGAAGGPAAARGRAASVTADEAGIMRLELESGATILVRPERAVPVVSVRAAYTGGLRLEDASTNGISRLLARSLIKGTQRSSAREVATLSDRLGASLGGVAGRNSFGLRGDFLAKEFEASLRLFADCLQAPAFEPKEIERERALQLEEIRTRDDNPSSVAFDLFSKTLYTQHPYRFDLLGTEESLEKLTPEALFAWHARHHTSERLVLSIAGDVDPQRAFALAEELFGGPAGGRDPLPELEDEPTPTAQRRGERIMEKEQAHLVLGFLGARFADPDRYPLAVLASVLAGQGGRLFYELRDKRSMAYSVTAFNLEGLERGYFGVYIGTSPEKLAEAEAGIRDELDKVLQGPVSEEELERAKRYLIGSHAIGLQRNSARAASIALDEAYGLGASHFLHYPEAIERVVREEVLEAARRYIALDRSVVAVVTPASR